MGKPGKPGKPGQQDISLPLPLGDDDPLSAHEAGRLSIARSTGGERTREGQEGKAVD